MEYKTCSRCDNQIKQTRIHCSYCGFRVKHTEIGFGLIGLIVLGFILMLDIDLYTAYFGVVLAISSLIGYVILTLQLDEPDK